MPHRVKSAERVLDILEWVAQGPEGCTFTALRQALALPKSSTHDLLAGLTARGYLRWSPTDGTYRLGLKVFELAATSKPMGLLQDVARPIMRALVAQAGETSHLAVLDAAEVVYLGTERPATATHQIGTAVGSRLPAHLTATGKVLLAYRSDDALCCLFGSEQLPTRTPSSVATLTALRAQLAEIRQQGFAVEREETRLGVMCMAAPIFYHASEPIAAVSFTVLRAGCEAPRLAALRQWLVAAAQEMSCQLSAQSGPGRLPAGSRAATSPERRGQRQARARSTHQR